MSFSQLRISSNVLKGLKDVKIESPSPLQKKIINAIKEGGDVLIDSSDGDHIETGYMVPVLDTIAKQDRRQGTKAIILTDNPDRVHELDKWIWAVGYHAGIESAPIEEKGVIEEQKSVLLAGPTIIVATPGRLSQLMEENRIIFREAGYMILDQADTFTKWDQVDVISKRIIGKCKRIATIEKKENEILEKLDSFLTEPETVGFDGKKPGKKPLSTSTNGTGVAKDLTQYYIKVPPRMKISTLMAHLEKTPTDSVLIFAASRRTADRLYRILRKSGRRAVSLHSKLNKDTFNERFGRFTSGDVQHLIAGDLSADDLDIGQVTQVVNYDVPDDTQEYRKRAELVGDGKATRILSLVSKQDRSDINEISKKLGYAPEEIPLPESVKEKKGKKRDKGRSKRHSGKKKRQDRRGKNKTKSREEQPSMGLPRPSYDKLSGGRSGKKKKEEEKSGIVGFFKKLFS